MADALPLLTAQFDLVHRLAGYHLPELSDEMCLWQPAPEAWTVHRQPDGRWRPDWNGEEPNLAPPVTIGWMTWQMIWWLSGMLASLRGKVPLKPEAVDWPGCGEAAGRQIESLLQEYRLALGGLTEEALTPNFVFPWREPRPLGDAIMWANAELMKNIAEIGCIRHLFLATLEQRKRR